MQQVVQWFELGGEIKLSDTASAHEVLEGLKNIQGLTDKLAPVGIKSKDEPEVLVSAAEFVLEGLHAHRGSDGQKNASLPQTSSQNGRSVRLSAAMMSRHRCGIVVRTINWRQATELAADFRRCTQIKNLAANKRENARINFANC